METGQGQVLKICLQDDSNEELKTRNVQYGLGTKIFNLVTDGNWQISRTETGTLLILAFDMERELS